MDNPPGSVHLSSAAPILVDKHTFIPAFQSARRISEPWRPLRCSLSRFCNCFSAAMPTKRLCDRLRSGLFLVFGHFYAAKRISGLRRGFRCQAAAGYNNSRHYRIHPSNGGWYVDTLEHEVTAGWHIPCFDFPSVISAVLRMGSENRPIVGNYGW